jgi:UDP-N-acetylmuramate dehydrogenase
MILRENVPLAPLTTLSVGGPARYFVEAQSEADVVEALQFAETRSLRLFVLGCGSNLVVADAGFDGLILRMAFRGVSRADDDATATFEVAAGEDWDAFVSRAVDSGCAGIECLSGIPGTVGGTPVQNVGAYGQEVAETIREVEVLDRLTGQCKTLSNRDCGFGYRSSRFNTSDKDRFIILRVSFVLRRDSRPVIRYPELREVLATKGIKDNLKSVRSTVLEIRQRKSMVLDAEDENRRSVGSFFKNPIISQSDFESLSARVEVRGVTVPSYPAAEGSRKIPAAWLVEQAGFHKGYKKGAAGISTNHALAIVNRGDATAVEIVGLKNDIQSQVLAEFGIQLQAEPVFLGF